VCLLAKHGAFFIQRLNEKTRFPVSRGCPEALIRRGGKITRLSIAYILSNIFALNNVNRLVYLEAIGQ